MKVPVTFGESRSNHSRDIRLPQLVTNSDENDDATTTTTTPAEGPYDKRAKRRLVAFCLKKNCEGQYFDQQNGMQRL